MTAHAAVGIHDDLAPGQAAVALGAADDETAGRVDEEARLVVEQVRGDHLLDQHLDDDAVDFLVLHVRRVLRADDDRVDPLRGMSVVFDGHLGLRVGAQPGQFLALAQAGQFLAETVRKLDGQRHQFRRLVRGKPEHESLVARALFGGVLALVARRH